MAVRTDILLDDNNDLRIAYGDFIIGNSDNQNAAIILDVFKGGFKQNPVIGAGISAFLKTNFKRRELKRHITVELQRDNYTDVNINVDYNTGILNIDIND